ncbi:MAG: bifunctional 3-demethylubiquinol 3-O-methyltransferase/2-polyprenyl-6-hydroxyphenol methylase [Magnetovibrio sp.]|nr:bifunctional 3-demethylubiquinol 3-O-methyltransferase/2-polyprenyl-6-hydroxyphenol methylase [Magnetovibrio sp.]|tara:strand:- start:1322 stop:2056 length:735 start_codon:yes stop_codon:yes gene_type:complete
MSNTNSISQDEIERFTAIAEDWWNPDGMFRPLHQLNPVRLNFIRDHLATHFGRRPLEDKPLAGLKIIDIGCGGGLLAEPLSRMGAEVTGIDASLETINVAKHHASEMGLSINYRQRAPESLANERGQYDAALNMEVVEHVSDLHGFLSASSSLVRPGGAMVISTINRSLKSLVIAKFGAEYIMHWLPKGTHNWRKFRRPSEITNSIRAHDFTIRELTGMSYSLIEDTWSLTNDLNVNYLLFATR